MRSSLIFLVGLGFLFIGLKVSHGAQGPAPGPPPQATQEPGIIPPTHRHPHPYYVHQPYQNQPKHQHTHNHYPNHEHGPPKGSNILEIKADLSPSPPHEPALEDKTESEVPLPPPENIQNEDISNAIEQDDSTSKESPPEPIKTEDDADEVEDDDESEEEDLQQTIVPEPQVTEEPKKVEEYIDPMPQSDNHDHEHHIIVPEPQVTEEPKKVDEHLEPMPQLYNHDNENQTIVPEIQITEEPKQIEESLDQMPQSDNHDLNPSPPDEPVLEDKTKSEIPILTPKNIQNEDIPAVIEQDDSTSKKLPSESIKTEDDANEVEGDDEYEDLQQAIVPEPQVTEEPKKVEEYLDPIPQSDNHDPSASPPHEPVLENETKSEVPLATPENIRNENISNAIEQDDSTSNELPPEAIKTEDDAKEAEGDDESEDLQQTIVPELQETEELKKEEEYLEPIPESDNHDHEHHITVPEPQVIEEPKKVEEYLDPIPQSDSDNHEHEHHHHSHDHFHQHEDLKNQPSYIVVIKHLSATLVSFLPEYLQDMILDVNDALVFTGIIALTLISICVPYFFIAAFLSARPLKKRVTELNKTLWKVSTAYENQQEEYEAYKTKALAYDEDQKRIEKLEIELDLVKKLESKQKDQIRLLQKRLKSGSQVASEVESLVESTMDERNKAVEECTKLKAAVSSLQTTLKHTSEELETAQSELENFRMDIKLANHTKENLESKVEANNREIAELRKKVLAEVEIRRKAQSDYEELLKDKSAVEEQLQEAKALCHKYEESVSSLNDEIFQKENELLALKETLGEDSPLVEISEISARLKVAEGQSTSLQSRVESLTLENSSLTRDLVKTKEALETLQAEKDSAETRLQVLESYFNEKDEQHRIMVEKYEQERNLRGKDKEELAQMIEEKNDEIRDLNNRLEQLKDEFEQSKVTHKSEIRKMENKIHEDWLSICQSERKAQESKKEADLLRQKLTTVTKAKENDAIDGLSTAGDRVPYSPFLDFDDVPPPLDIDEPPPPLSMPSYFGLPVDFEPPCPLEEDETMDSLHGNRPGAEGEPLRPPPLGRLSPTTSDVIDDIVSPIMGPGGRGHYHGHPGPRDEYSDGSSSPQNNNNNWSSRNGTHSSLSNRGGPPGRDSNSGPLRTSSPVPNYNQPQYQSHGINL